MAETGLDPVTGQAIVEMVLEPAHVAHDVPWPETEKIVRQGGRILRLGVDAMVGPRLAAAWEEDLPLDVLRRSTRVSVERGSTQRVARLQKVQVFRELWKEMVEPALEALAGAVPEFRLRAVAKAVEAARKTFEMMDLDDFEGLLPTMDEVEKEVLRSQAAEARAAAEAKAEAEAARLRSSGGSAAAAPPGAPAPVSG
jgi:hypothetical protein